MSVTRPPLSPWPPARHAPPVDLDLLDELVEGLSQQVREDEAPGLARQPKRLGIAGGRDPHRQLGLHRPRQGRDEHVLAQWSRKADALPAPEAPDRLDVRHHAVLRVRERFRPQDEVVRVPTRRERDADAPARQVVDERPLLGHANRVMKREHDAAGTDPDARRDRGNRGAHHRGIGVEAAERMKVPLRRPDGVEAVCVRKLRSLHQQPVLGGATVALVAGEIEQAEVNRTPGGERVGSTDGRVARLTLHHTL